MLSDDTVDNDDDTTVIQEKLIRTKGKCKNLRPNDIYVEVKTRNRSGKCMGAKQSQVRFQYSMERSDSEKPSLFYNTIQSDIWYHIADHIPPEYVQTFALICRQTSDLVNTRKFWNMLYKKYCLKSNANDNWLLALPARVIESLFYTYTPLSERLKQGYSLDKMLGYTYVSSWHEQENCIWIMCYKFLQKNITEKRGVKNLTELVSIDTETDDWETLADNSSWCKNQYKNSKEYINDGVSLLVIRCERFIPFPNQLLYEGGGSRVILLATRQMLAKDMCGLNLELDFGDTSSKIITTVKYPQVTSCKAYPWWHPDFRKYVKGNEFPKKTT
ncbi:uncharacterized protein LOC129245355 [Anastrepha obliqua]|uniref:uncharacterized protein LOC129245355 n=1 Tax=Anastrepha obliqua TaxID=95512 RepID=UPI00240A7F65|nr:uncharacterized protein LOC129245355 [Anastrepha obliqua]